MQPERLRCHSSGAMEDPTRPFGDLLSAINEASQTWEDAAERELSRRANGARCDGS
jgi:hypothetical protein